MGRLSRVEAVFVLVGRHSPLPHSSASAVLYDNNTSPLECLYPKFRGQRFPGVRRCLSIEISPFYTLCNLFSPFAMYFTGVIRMAAPRHADEPPRGLGPFIVKTQDLEKLAELGRGSFGVVIGGKLKIAAKVSTPP